MSRWGGLRVHWHYWCAFLAGVLYGVIPYSLFRLNRSVPPIFESVIKIGDFEIPIGVVMTGISAVAFPILAASVSWKIVRREPEDRGKAAFKSIAWDVNAFRPPNLFGGVHFASFLIWGNAVFWSVATRFPPLSVNAGWKTNAMLAGMFFAGAGVQIGARLVTDRYFYEGNESV